MLRYDEMAQSEKQRSHGSATADRSILIDVVHAVLGRCGGQRWTVRPTDSWCYVTPPESNERAHGWKLHVSATPLSAPLVLARSAEVLVRGGCSFKFGTDIRRVSELVGQWYGRGNGGKFITVYPGDDDEFVRLAEELHVATDGLPGPAILSDRRLKPDSLVYYRYGEIGGGERVFTDDGDYERRMAGPDGTVVADARRAWFSPPAWAVSPFDGEGSGALPAPESILLKERFRVRRAIRHANKGGIYRAVDEHTGADVVVKQARAHVSAELDGTDVRDRLRRESVNLDLLAPLRIAPRPIDLFEEQGDLFLVQEQVDGVTLAAWAENKVAAGGVPVAEATRMAGRLVDLVRTVHEAGFVIRDLKPANLMVTTTDEVRLVDVEFVSRRGVSARPVGTPGFLAPEATIGGSAIVPLEASDCYSLGVTLFWMATALQADWLQLTTDADVAAGNREILRQIVPAHPALAALVEPILGLTLHDTELRWDASRTSRYLAGLTPAVIDGPANAEGAPSTPDPVALDRLIARQVTEVRDGMNVEDTYLWKQAVSRSGDRDACAVWHGAAGALAVLTRAASVPDADRTLRDSVARAAKWIDDRLFSVPRVLPGLAFGRAGTAWALYDTATFLEDPTLQARALELAERLPDAGPMSDITHGLSGAGLARLHLWRATGRESLLHGALRCADNVLDAARREDDLWSWPVPDDVDSKLAGVNVYGLAHGVAGAGVFLLAAHQAADADRPGSAERYLEAAIGAGETLIRVARTGPTGVTWPAGVGSTESVKGLYWCGGAAGIGSFLIRLWAVTKEQALLDLAGHAADTVARNPWKDEVGACCGLSGAGHYLLDLADVTGQVVYRQHADALAHVVRHQIERFDRRRHLRGFDYQTGIPGVLGFLLRLRHGGPQPWLPSPAGTSV